MADRGWRLKKTVVLVGMMGAGKSAVGRALAEHLDVPFLDSDEALTEAANMSIAEIFERDGEPFFRAREAEVIARLMDTPGAVLSTGGGAFLREENRAVIDQKGVAVWLKADLDLLWSRVKHKDTRPLLRTADPKATLAALLEARGSAYAKAPLWVETQAGYSIQDTMGEVLKALKTRPDILEDLG